MLLFKLALHVVIRNIDITLNNNDILIDTIIIALKFLIISIINLEKYEKKITIIYKKLIFLFFTHLFK